MPYLERARRSAAAAELAEAVRRGWTGVRPQDVELCLEADSVPFAMAAARVDGHLELRAVDRSPLWLNSREDQEC